MYLIFVKWADIKFYWIIINSYPSDSINFKAIPLSFELFENFRPLSVKYLVELYFSRIVRAHCDYYLYFWIILKVIFDYAC
jgi:hypothetical protein